MLFHTYSFSATSFNITHVVTDESQGRIYGEGIDTGEFSLSPLGMCKACFLLDWTILNRFIFFLKDLFLIE